MAKTRARRLRLVSVSTTDSPHKAGAVDDLGGFAGARMVIIDCDTSSLVVD
jgi:hypothetical protein